MSNSSKLIGLLHKREPFSLPGTDVAGEFRILSTEAESKVMAIAKEDLIKDKQNNDLFWTSYYEDCATLAAAMMDGDKPLYETARILRLSLAKEEIDYLAAAYKSFIKTVMPKFDELDDTKIDELVNDFLAQTKTSEEWVSSGNLRECKKLVPSLVNHFLRLMRESGVSYTSLNEPLTVTPKLTRQRP